MASISKLSIRGIRSFSPEDDEQVISFCFPLTIIVGANGCGKTTIIEALKYAITGGLPPGNSSGKAFVHDPKNIGSSQVKAAIKLRFQNRAGKTMVVVRSMEVTQKKTTMTFKQLDGIVRTTDEQGNKISLSHKCTELDRQIPQLLGVSKAVLEHVVFCHQEDSSWPLMEGAVLKKRFDDIFDSTKYVKALAAIKDTKKKYVAIVKELKIELGELSGHKHAAVGFRQELDECRQTMSDIQDEIIDIQNKIDEEEHKCKEYKVTLQKYNKLEEDIENTLAENDKLEVMIETLRKGLKEDMSSTHSKDDLKIMLRAFDNTMKDDEDALTAARMKVKSLEDKIAQNKEKKMELGGEKGRLEGERDHHQQNLVKRVELIEELALSYGLELTFTQSQQTDIMSTQQSFETSLGHDISLSQGTSATNIHLTEEDLHAFKRSVEHKTNHFERDLKEFKLESQKAEDSLQTQLSDLKAKISTMDTAIVNYRKEYENASKELKSLPSTFSRMRKSDIDEAKRSAERFAKARNDLNNDPKRNTIPRQISENDAKISKIKIDIDELNTALKELRKCAEDQHNIDILEKQMRQDIELLDEMEKENSFLLQKYQVKLPDVKNVESAEVNRMMDSLLEEITDKFEKSKSDLEKAEEQLKSSSAQLSKLSAVLSHKQETLSKQKDQLTILSTDGRGVQQIKNAIKAVRQFETSTNGDIGFDPNADPQSLLLYFTKKIGELSNDDSQPESVSKVIKKLKKLSKIRNEDGVVVELRCPCCTRFLDEKTDEVAIFQDQMDTLADPNQSVLMKTDENTAKFNRSALNNYMNWRNIISKNINDWMDHQRISDEVESILITVVKDQEEVSRLQSLNDEDQENVDSLKDEMTDSQAIYELIRRFRDEIGKITSKKNQISTRKEEVKLSAPRAGGRDLNTTERELNAKMEEKDVLSNAISSLNKELSMLNENINQANISATRAENLVREKEKQFEQEQESMTRRNELNAKLAECQEQEDKLKSQMNPMKQNATTKEAEINRVRAAHETERDKKTALCNRFKNDADKIEEITKKIEDFKTGNKMHRIEQIDKEMKTIDDEVNEYELEMKEKGPMLEKLQNQIFDQDSHRMNIERNLEMINMITETLKLRDEVALLQDEQEAINGDAIKEKFNEANNLIRKYGSEKDRREGSKDSLQCQFRDLKRKLQTPEYKDIDERHRVKMIETETSSLAVQDLEVYHSALDKALLRYHGLKLGEINKIIAELWALTYRGEDITNIRLTSDQDSNSRSTRSYNYRVIMTKGTTELDMRGRCSAGQRVLASIVIRLALAETFCVNCGVMALDEPTTNLDFANKRGLAIALAQIIAHRAAQDNFQLVIITHDEDFVSMMKTELATHAGFTMPERYFQVSRHEGNDGCYYSKIHSVDWDEL